MKKNMGMLDRVLRTTLAMVDGVLYFTGQVTGTAAIVLGIFAVIFGNQQRGILPCLQITGNIDIEKGTRSIAETIQIRNSFS